MTRGAGTCWQQEDDDGFQIWLEPPRDHQKPFTDSERAQRWRLSLASLLFLTVLLSDRLWFCAEARLARTPDKFASSHLRSPHTHSVHISLTENPHAIFLGNSTKHLCRLETRHRDSSSGDCFAFADADDLCRGLSDKQGPRVANMSDLFLSFCNSYSLLDLFDGSASPDNLNCSVRALEDGDATRCGECVQAYQRYDQHAQEKYEDFELLTEKYEPGAYSVRTCMEQCKTFLSPDFPEHIPASPHQPPLTLLNRGDGRTKKQQIRQHGCSEIAHRLIRWGRSVSESFSRAPVYSTLHQQGIGSE